MTAFQRVIKYLAIALAIFIIFSIFSVIGELGSGIFGFLLNRTNTTIVDTININNAINTIDIDLKYANLDIKKSDVFKVEISNKKINVEESDNKLTIKDNSKKFISNTKETVILYLPDYVLNDTIINTGAGDLNIEYLITNNLNLDLGVGKTIIDYIEATKSTIKTGVGTLIINDAKLNNSDIDIGIGKSIIRGILTGDNTIDAGVGETTLELVGNKNDYKIKFNKGIGNIKYNNENVANNSTIGDGNTTISIDGGIGNFIVKTVTINSDF